MIVFVVALLRGNRKAMSSFLRDILPYSVELKCSGISSYENPTTVKRPPLVMNRQLRVNAYPPTLSIREESPNKVSTQERNCCSHLGCTSRQLKRYNPETWPQYSRSVASMLSWLRSILKKRREVLYHTNTEREKHRYHVIMTFRKSLRNNMNTS